MRLEGWEARLAAVIETARQEPYVLGVHDCFKVACMTVEALTGVDRWPEFAGRYRTKREALALLARYGSSFDTAFSWFFEGDPFDMKFAHRGDIAKFVDPSGEAHLGVVVGLEVAVLGEKGLAFLPRTACVHAWRVG